ncbi:transporter [Pseudomonas protegens]|uniref:transporter n=1 Tax=Pseudomonas protegens TaxID=380021 RepID=UPI001C69D268|nr:transporter [Pseudomonas protegens]QYN04417.1 transporter [Pseudomonas protegens]
MRIACQLALCSTLLGSLAALANELPALGEDGKRPAAKGDPETCRQLQENFDIDLKQVVKAGCEPSTEQIAKLMDNPVGNLVLLFNQFDYTALKGPHSNGTRYLGKYSFMPTFPISLGEDWNLINRLPISYVSAPVNRKAGKLVGLSPYEVLSDRDFPALIEDPFQRTSGFGDLAYVGVFSPKEPLRFAGGGKLVWGVGPTAMFPTAEQDVLGTGKYSLGPAFVAAYLGPDWTLGVFPQHWWSVAGDGRRKDVSLSNIQYFIQRALPGPAQWRIGMPPNITVNWKADGGNKVTFPIGLGAGRIFNVGKLPVRISGEVQYSAIHPDDQIGSRWNFRLSFIPVIPTFMF